MPVFFKKLNNTGIASKCLAIPKKTMIRNKWKHNTILKIVENNGAILLSKYEGIKEDGAFYKKISKSNRVIIPKELLNIIGVKENQNFKVTEENSILIIEKIYY